MFKFTHSFFYNIEGAAMWVQSKIWRKYATSTWGIRVTRTTIAMLSMSLTYLVYSLTGWHPFYLSLGFIILGFAFLFSYHSDAKYDKIDDYEILSDFNRLSNCTRYFYLSYVLGFFYLLPLALILFIIIDKLLL